MSTDRFCVNCAHHRQFKVETLIGPRVCQKTPTEPDRVTGVSYPMPCALARLAVAPCGPEGKLFEPKPEPKPKWRKLWWTNT
jgi:hypothetical protein